MNDVFEFDAAMRSDAPVLNDAVFTSGAERAPGKPSNVANRAELGHGDVETGFADADVTVERSYKT